MYFDGKEDLLKYAARGDIVLFLGAGVNVGCKFTAEQLDAPLGNGLAEEINRHFFPNEKNTARSLRAISTKLYGLNKKEALVDWLKYRLGVPSLSKAVRNVPLIRWASIYTVNIDFVLETAYRSTPERVQVLCPVVTPSDIAERRNGEAVGYYKLHGCVNVPDSDLIFDHRDYSEARERKLRLFNSLSVDLCEKPFLFVGFSMEDSDFQDVWASVLKYTNSSSRLHPTYVVVHEPSDSDIESMSRMGFTVISSSSSEIFPWLRANLPAVPPSVLQVEENNARPVRMWSEKRFGLDVPTDVACGIEKNFLTVEKVVASLGGGVSRYLSGASPKWEDIVAGRAVSRDLFEDIKARITSWMADPGAQTLMVLGAAGYGKSTFLMQIAYDLVVPNADFPVFWARTSADFDAMVIAQFSNACERMPVVVFIDDAVNFFYEIRSLYSASKRDGIPVLIIGAARKAEWNDVLGVSGYPDVDQYSLPRLSRGEAKRLASVVMREGIVSEVLGVDSVKSLADHFYESSERHIVAGLLTAVTGYLSFDEIIAKEYHRIGSSIAKSVYKCVSVAHSFGHHVPWRLVCDVVELSYAELNDLLSKSLDEIVLGYDWESDLCLGAQHRVIAEELVRKVLEPDDVASVISTIAEKIDLHNAAQRALFISLYNDHKLSRIVDGDSRIRELYLQFERLFIEDSFVVMHHAIFESSVGDFEESRRLIGESLRISGGNLHAYNTLGNIWLKEAIAADDPDASLYALRKGCDILQNLIGRDSDKQVHYHALIDKLIKWSRKPGIGADLRFKALADAEHELRLALSACPQSDNLMTLRAQLSLELGREPEAEKYVKVILKKDPGNLKAWSLLVRLYCNAGDFHGALACAREGLQKDGRCVPLLKAVIDCLIELDVEWLELREAFRAYLDKCQIDFKVRLLYVKYLVENGDYAEAKRNLDFIKRLPVPVWLKLQTKYPLISEGRPLKMTGTFRFNGPSRGFVDLDGCPKGLDAFIDVVPFAKGRTFKKGSVLHVILKLNGVGLYVEDVVSVD